MKLLETDAFRTGKTYKTEIFTSQSKKSRKYPKIANVHVDRQGILTVILEDGEGFCYYLGE